MANIFQRIAAAAPARVDDGAPLRGGSRPGGVANDPWASIRQQIQAMSGRASVFNPSEALGFNPNDPSMSNPNAGMTRNIAWGNVPGLERFYSYDQNNNEERFDLAAAMPEIEARGYKWMTARDPGSETTGNWLVGPDGKPIERSARFTGTNDDNFKLAALAAMSVTGANVLGAGFGVGGAAAGPTASPVAQTFPVSPGGPMPTTQLGQLAAGGPTPLNMATIESGLGTAGYGYNAAAAAATDAGGAAMFNPATIGSGAASMFGPGGSVIPYTASGVNAVTGAAPAGAAPAGTPPVVPPGTPGPGTPADEGFNWKDLFSPTGARSLLDLFSGLYGLDLAKDAREQSDPFAQYRPGYGEALANLEANPGSITQRPGWLAGTELINRQMASRGYTGSGNEIAALSRYSGDFYNQEANRLATLAGAGQTPGAGQFSSAQLASQSLGSIGYGIAPWLPNKP